MERRILVIEDNEDIARLVALHLSTLGAQVQTLADGREGLQAALDQPPDLLVLDLTLPGLDGLEICRALRRQRAHVPILMLTARTSELDRVLGLELGADDYLVKPFSVLELVARAKALLRRMAALHDAAPPDAAPRPDEHLALGGLQIDVARREVRAGERSIELTAKEFDLLLHFARSPGRVMTRLQLLQQVWGYGHSGYEHTVNTHINRLRAKIEADPNRPEIIQTVWGVGYRGCDTRERSAARPALV